VRAYQRRQLKQDQFVTTTRETFSWAAEHRDPLLWGGIVVGVIVLLAAGAWFYLQHQDQEAGAELGRAMALYNAPLRPAGTPASSQIRSFASADERAKAANAEFQKVVDQYPRTRSAALARYFVGLTAMDMGDNAAAERALKEAAGARDADLAALAKFALASLYHRTQRDADAITLYKELIDNPTRTVAKASAQLELAGVYESALPAEARRLYEEIRKENPQGPAAQIADSKLK
jgi:tetratricopeptide (TPR) repeat protein